MRIKKITTGHIEEIYCYNEPYIEETIDQIDVANGLEYIAKKTKTKGGRKKGKKEERIYSCVTSTRRKNMIRRLINANFDQKSLFVTLTFRDKVSDDEAVEKLKEWFKKANRHLLDGGYDKLKYVAVMEHTEKRQHFHIIMRVQDWTVLKLWKHGYRHFTKIKSVDNIGAYMVKYMSKQTEQTEYGKSGYWRSKNLNNPKTENSYIIQDAEGILNELSRKKNLVFVNSYHDYGGNTIYYHEYNSKRNKFVKSD